MTDERPEKNRPVHIPDDYDGTPTEDNIYPPEYEGHLGKVMIRHDEILARTEKLAGLISEDYRGRRPVLVCVLKGAAPFFHHLASKLAERRQGFSPSYIRASSYHGATTDTAGEVGVVTEGMDLEALRGRDVILVEDIVDTGTTLARLIPLLAERGKARSVEVCTLLEKRLDEGRRREGVTATKAKYAGFSIPSHFVLGFGLDYNELYRDLQDIWVISQAGIEFDGDL